MTCNPSWEEITSELLPGQASHDRPDLLTRIFRSKYEELKQDIFHKGVLGVVIAHVHVIEFQKRGLPHCHMLVIFDAADKLNSPDDYDTIVRAELPDQQSEPDLYAVVLRHMIHGPCGAYKPNAPCMRDSRCKKGFPKPYAATTVQGVDSYPLYRRRNDNKSVKIDRHEEDFVDNGWVVPYNSWLLLKYNCHLNVEVCCSIKSIKYLYKYVYKGPYHIAFEIRLAQTYDEVNTKAASALTKQASVLFHNDENITLILANDRNSRTMLTEFFHVYMNGQEEHKYLYKEFPKYYRWLKPERKWKKRSTNQKVVGRLYDVSPNEGERFFLHLLLSHVPDPKSFNDLLTVNNAHHSTFKQAAEAYGLLEQDNSIRECLAEARLFRMPSALRRLFATILLYSNPTGVRSLWEENYASMAEDFASTSNPDNLYIINKVLYNIAGILNEHKRTLQEFDLPAISPNFEDLRNASGILEHELSILTPLEDLRAVESLNTDQLHAFTAISEAITTKCSATFFVDGPGGTGKTFLYRAILAKFRSDGCIVLATASSGLRRLYYLVAGLHIQNLKFLYN